MILLWMQLIHMVVYVVLEVDWIEWMFVVMKYIVVNESPKWSWNAL